MKRFPVIGACGLDCGLCPRYYTRGKSKCDGCGSPYSYAAVGCKIFRCCVKEKDLETCAECTEFPCAKLDDAWEYDSFLTHRRMKTNLNYIREKGVEDHACKLEGRMALLGEMLSGFDEGRSKSLYCVAATLLSVEGIREAISCANETVERLGVEKVDVKSRGNILKGTIHDVATKEAVDLRLRKPPRER